MPALIVGFHCSHEQHAPSVLLRHARLAGEALNESITGETWPPREARNVRLEASAAVIAACGERLLPELTHVH